LSAHFGVAFRFVEMPRIVIRAVVVAITWFILSFRLLILLANFADTSDRDIPEPAWLKIAAPIFYFPMEYLGPWPKSAEGFAEADVGALGFVTLVVNAIFWGALVGGICEIAPKCFSRKIKSR
jgi:hypothetical protein